MLKFFRVPFALSGDRTPVPDAADASGYVSYIEGYGPDYQRAKTDALSKNIERDKMNELFYDATNAIAEIQQQGIPDFIDSTLNGGSPFSYGMYAVVKYSGHTYISIASSNTATPGTDHAKWLLFDTPASSDFDAKLNYVAGSIGKTLKGWVCPQDYPWLADNTGVADATSAIQDCIDWAKTNGYGVDLRSGVYSVGPLTLNGAGYVGPSNDQWSSVVAFKGAGRAFGLCTLKARTGLYASGEYVLTGRNMSGVEVHGFSVDGDSIAECGIDLEWIGGSGGTPGLAPSTNNRFYGLFVQGCLGQSLKLNQMNDAPIKDIWTRGTDADNFAIQFKGDGGQIMLDGTWVGTGKVELAAQNGGISNCGFFGGLELAGASYNNFAFSNVHLFPRSATGVTVNSTATGNATRGVSFTGCYFNACTNVLDGRWHEGITFTACKFQTYTAFFAAGFTPAGGSGNVPVVYFRNGSFEGATPASIAGVVTVVLEGRKDSAGSIVSSTDTFSFTPTIAFGGASTGITYTRQVGRASIVGRRCFFTGRVTLSAIGSATGVMSVEGLPYTSVAVTGHLPPVALWGNSFASGVGCPQGVIPNGTSHITIYNFSSGSATALTNSSCNSTTDISFSGHFDF